MDHRDFPFQLRSAVWEITLACCFRCAYCGSRGGKARENELTTAEGLDVARQLAEMGCRRVSLIGGEVFMRPDWAALAGALTVRGVKVCIITNGFHMTPALVREIKQIGVESVAVSVDGVRTVHDAFRQKGSYDRAIQTLRTLAAAKIPVSVITSLRADNAPLLPELYRELRRLPLFAWQLQACSPMGNADDNRVAVAFDARRVLRFVAETAPIAPFAVGVADNIGYYTPEEGGVRGVQGALFEGCSAGLTTVGIDSAGNVRGCESMYDARFIEGNLRERSLWDIWTDPGAFAYNRRFSEDRLTGVCRTCPYGGVCVAGCRSYNYFTTGRLYENCLCARSAAEKNGC
jgi:radical SAM protein with 4Fe4S-binding SPASM domain